MGIFSRRKETPASPEPSLDQQSSAPALDADEMVDVFNNLARTLILGVNRQRGESISKLDVTLRFDELQRVEGLSGIADGTPALPDMASIEEMNLITAPLAQQPAINHLQTLRIEYDDGAVEYNASYRS